jgi:hypothetical protein
VGLKLDAEECGFPSTPSTPAVPGAAREWTGLANLDEKKVVKRVCVATTHSEKPFLELLVPGLRRLGGRASPVYDASEKPRGLLYIVSVCHFISVLI